MQFEIDNSHRLQSQPLDLPQRLLLGPGPSNPHPRVLSAIGAEVVGHLDPAFIALMNEVQDLLRYVFQTNNELTIPVSGTGSAAMEASIANLVEPGDVVLIAVNGYFGERLAEMAGRYRADVRTLEKPWGEFFSQDDLRKGLEQHKPRILGLVHGETSTGVCQPMDGIGELCREHVCLLLVDTVASLGGVPFFTDKWGADIVYSGSQKCLSCPPGLAPITLGPRAVEKLQNRRTKVANWYLDLTLLTKYWGSERTYHHTAPINMNYALREALFILAEEGLEASWSRHRQTAEYLWDGLAEIDLTPLVPYDHRLVSLTTVRVPQGLDAKEVSNRLLKEYNIEVAGGFGPLAGQVWRVGLMGFNSQIESVDRLLTALKAIISN
jgi:alanine-glyoxylate transaminase/serine-glyoxylate transaminase/serine-pyruvate transaminase